MHAKRVALAVVKVRAGSNADSAYKSYDDNEATAWYNDGNANTAWIEYELEKESNVGAVVLKLNNFRTRSYPLRITVDDKEVWKGSTQKTLGYSTISFTATKGKHVKIELSGATADTADKALEVNGKN